MDTFPIEKKQAGALLPSVVLLLSDGNARVRNAAKASIVKMHRQIGPQIGTALERMNLDQKHRVAMKEVFEDAVPLSPRNPPTPKQRKQKASKSSPQRNIVKHKKKRSKFSKTSLEPVKIPEGKSSVPVPDGVKAVNVYSERDLSDEVKKIMATLSDVRNNGWSKRISALNRLAGLVMAGAHDIDNFIPLLKKNKDAIVEQLKDLRSAVVKHTCNVLAYMSSVMLNGLECIMEYVIPVLSKLNCVTIQVMSESADYCMSVLLTHTRCPRRAVGKILDMANAKAPVVRAKSLSYLTVLLNPGPTDLTKQLDTIVELLRKRVTDASAPTRAAARGCYSALAQRWPSRAEHLAASLDPKTQRYLTQGTTHSPPTSPRIVSAHSRTGSCGQLQPHAERKLKRMATVASVSPSRSSPKSKRENNMGKTWSHQTLRDTGAGTGSGSSTSRRSLLRRNQSTRQITTPRAAPSRTKAKHASTWDNATPPRRNKSPVARNHNANGEMRRGAKRAPVRMKMESSSPKASKSRFYLGGGATRVHRQPVAAKVEQVTSPRSSPNDGVAKSPYTSRPESPAGATSSAERPGTSGGSTPSTGHVRSASQGSATALKRALDDANGSNDWQGKIRSLKVVTAALQRNRGVVSPHLAGRLMKLYEHRLPDGHQKVAACALESVPSLVYALGDTVIPLLGRLLNLILPRLQDTRPANRRAAQAAVNALSEKLGTQMMQPLIRAAGSSSPQVRSSALTTLAMLIPTPGYKTYFASQSNLDGAIKAAIRCLKSSRPGANPLRKPPVELLAAILATFPAGLKAHSETASDKDKIILAKSLRQAADLNKKASRPNGSVGDTKATSSTENIVAISLEKQSTAVVEASERASEVDVQHESVKTEPHPILQELTPVKTEDAKREIRPATRIPTESPTHTLVGERVPEGTPEPMAPQSVIEMHSEGLAKELNPKPKKPKPRPGILIDKTGTTEMRSSPSRAFGGVTVEQVLGRLTEPSRQAKLEAIDVLSWMARQKYSLWDTDFNRMLLGLLYELEGTDAGVIMLVLQVIREVLIKYIKKFRDWAHVEFLVTALFEVLRCEKLPMKNSCESVQSCIGLLASKAEPSQIWPVFVASIQCELSSSDVASKGTQGERSKIITRLALRAIAVLIRRMPKNVLMEGIDRIAPPLARCFRHQSVNVRKEAVECFVASHEVAGDSVLSHLTALKPQQLRLIKIYIDKTAARRRGQNTDSKQALEPRRPPLQLVHGRGTTELGQSSRGGMSRAKENLTLPTSLNDGWGRQGC